MKYFFLFFSFVATLCIVKAQNVSYEFSLQNPSDKDLTNCVAEIPISELNKLTPENLIASDGKTIVPIEVSTDLTGKTFIIFPFELKRKETKVFHIKTGNAYSYPKRTYAEIVHKIGGQFEGKKYTGGYWTKSNYLKAPSNLKDHANFIKYEGPGWESDKVAFRLYLDPRNAIDVFAKRIPQIVLPYIGTSEYGTYHKLADWGMDNMKVEKSLGIGAIGIWDGKKVSRIEKTDSVIAFVQADGKIRSQVRITYYGWNNGNSKCDLQSLISIDAGSRASHMELSTNNKVEHLCTGFIKNENTEFLTGKSGRWTYIASFGKQSLNNDMMGLAIFAKTSQVKEITNDELNHVVVFNTAGNYTDYYFMPTWELDQEPVVTKTDFQQCIDEVLSRLNRPAWK